MLLRFLTLLLLSSSTTSYILHCTFRMSGWWDGPMFYECEDTVTIIKSKDERKITELNGTHLRGRTNDDVLSFYAYRMNIACFPKGLDTYFKNIQYLGIVNAKLKEIHQEDLKPFFKLKVLYLDSNDLEVLEENLFEFNTNLEVININSNKIKFVDVSVFRNLFKLNYLWFDYNNCYSNKVSNDFRGVRKMINEINENCFVNNILSDFRKFQEKELTSLKAEIEILRVENAKLRDENTELKINEAKCLNLRENLGKCEKEKENCENENGVCVKDLKNFADLTISRIKCEN
ncbi:unnamed protein product [Chironomus riparius]|uniref:Uncharacterized protein n=1 Tax=Chironomus riparius TaxID=315576 RepID=A0A9N9WYK5_9DIPT|nr:unnamed protein product [Chironomus riparius]